MLYVLQNDIQTELTASLFHWFVKKEQSASAADEEKEEDWVLFLEDRPLWAVLVIYTFWVRFMAVHKTHTILTQLAIRLLLFE